MTVITLKLSLLSLAKSDMEFVKSLHRRVFQVKKNYPKKRKKQQMSNCDKTAKNISRQ